jgi:hypothetical protein
MPRRARGRAAKTPRRPHKTPCKISFRDIFFFCSFLLKVSIANPESSLPRQFAGLLRAILLTLALAVVCRFLPGGIGDRSGGVAGDAPPSA